MMKSVKEVSSLSGVSEKTVRRYIHNNNLEKELSTNNQGGYLIPDEIANEIKKQYENKILAKDQLHNHRSSQLKNTRDIIFKSLVERDLRGSNPKTEKQMLWLLMMVFDKIDDVNNTLDDLETSLDFLESDTESLSNDLTDIYNELVDIQKQIAPHTSKVKLISALSNEDKLESKVNDWLKDNNIKPLKIDFQSASRTNAKGDLEIVYTALISYRTEE